MLSIEYQAFLEKQFVTHVNIIFYPTCKINFSKENYLDFKYFSLASDLGEELRQLILAIYNDHLSPDGKV